MSKKQVLDSPEQKKKCLSCKLPECINCVALKARKRYRSGDYIMNQKYDFFGRQMTIPDISRETGISKGRLYSYNRTGGIEHIKRKVVQLGYKPKGE